MCTEVHCLIKRGYKDLSNLRFLFPFTVAWSVVIQREKYYQQTKTLDAEKSVVRWQEHQKHVIQLLCRLLLHVHLLVHQLAIESTANVLQCSPPESRQCCSTSMIAERLLNADWLTSRQWQQNSPGMAEVWKNIQNIQKCSLKSTDCGPQTANKM